MVNLDLLLKAISSTLDPKKVILFGSVARGEKGNDVDIAIIQNEAPKLGQKADIFLNLTKLNYDWKVEPDLHIFSEKDFEDKLKQRDLFVTEISKGKTLYVKT